jgi:hypothetical protein
MPQAGAKPLRRWAAARRNCCSNSFPDRFRAP